MNAAGKSPGFRIAKQQGPMFRIAKFVEGHRSRTKEEAEQIARSMTWWAKGMKCVGSDGRWWVYQVVRRNK